MTGVEPAVAPTSSQPCRQRWPWWPDVVACLRRGDIVVLLLPVDGGVVAARDAVRALCTDVLAALAALAPAPHWLIPATSRSATPGLAALALGSLPGIGIGVGVDVERRRPEWVDADLLELALHADERQRWPGGAAADRGLFFDLWTRKEAVMKALGLGLALPPSSFDAGPPNDGWHDLRTPAGPARVRRVFVPPHGADGADGFAAAVATAGEGAAAAVETFVVDGC